LEGRPNELYSMILIKTYVKLINKLSYNYINILRFFNDTFKYFYQNIFKWHNTDLSQNNAVTK
jgi:hypothetical protein